MLNSTSHATDCNRQAAAVSRNQQVKSPVPPRHPLPFPPSPINSAGTCRGTRSPSPSPPHYWSTPASSPTATPQPRDWPTTWDLPEYRPCRVACTHQGRLGAGDAGGESTQRPADLADLVGARYTYQYYPRVPMRQVSDPLQPVAVHLQPVAVPLQPAAVPLQPAAAETRMSEELNERNVRSLPEISDASAYPLPHLLPYHSPATPAPAASYPQVGP